jgi:hypothetical protein
MATLQIPGLSGGDMTSEVVVEVGGDRVVVSYDAGHLAAHAGDFAISWQELVRAIARALGSREARTGVIHEGFSQPGVVGRTGVVAVEPGGPAFWGYRPGRTVPSHLVAGAKVETGRLCVWGTWASRDRFDLWTCYPGDPAPREIHDPDIQLDEIDEAIAFWSVHAIVVDGDDEAGR